MKKLLFIFFILLAFDSFSQTSAKKLLLSQVSAPEFFTSGDTTTTNLVGAPGINIKYPAIVNAGDDLFMIVGSDLGGTFNTVSGWTMLTEKHSGYLNVGSYAVYKKTAIGTEDGTTEYVTLSYSGGALFGMIVSFINGSTITSENYDESKYLDNQSWLFYMIPDSELEVHFDIFFSLYSFNAASLSYTSTMTENASKLFTRSGRNFIIKVLSGTNGTYNSSWTYPTAIQFATFNIRLSE
jgi:hypothetical protein